MRGGRIRERGEILGGRVEMEGGGEKEGEEGTWGGESGEQLGVRENVGNFASRSAALRRQAGDKGWEGERPTTTPSTLINTFVPLQDRAVSRLKYYLNKIAAEHAILYMH